MRGRKRTLDKLRSGSDSTLDKSIIWNKLFNCQALRQTPNLVVSGWEQVFIPRICNQIFDLKKLEEGWKDKLGVWD